MDGPWCKEPTHMDRGAGNRGNTDFSPTLTWKLPSLSKLWRTKDANRTGEPSGSSLSLWREHPWWAWSSCWDRESSSSKGRAFQVLIFPPSEEQTLWMWKLHRIIRNFLDSKFHVKPNTCQWSLEWRPQCCGHRAAVTRLWSQSCSHRAQ